MSSLWGMGSGGSEKEGTIVELKLEGCEGFFSQRKEEGHCEQRDQLQQRQRRWAPVSQGLFTMNNYN